MRDRSKNFNQRTNYLQESKIKKEQFNHLDTKNIQRDHKEEMSLFSKEKQCGITMNQIIYALI